MRPPCDWPKCNLDAKWALRWQKNGIRVSKFLCSHHVEEEESIRREDKWQLVIRAHTGR